MKMILNSLGLILSSTLVKSQNIVESFTYTIAQSADFAPETILDIHLNDTSLVEEVFNHGCFCSKIYHWNDKNIRGGHQSIDDFDEICKNWFRCRECNDKHIGGSCKDEGVDPHTADFEYELIQNVLDDGNVVYDCSSNSDNCAYDSCIIDIEYIEQAALFLDNASNFISSGINATSCPRSTEPVIPRFCNGTAPNLYTTKQYVEGGVQEPAAVIANNPQITSQITGAAVEAEGNTCSDNTCGCTGGTGSANVQYFQTDQTLTFDDGQALCAGMGLTLATARSSAESSLLSAHNVNSWVGGRRLNTVDKNDPDFHVWVWDIDLTPLTWFSWRNREPNNWQGAGEACIEMFTNGQWNDIRCISPRTIVCEQRFCSP